MNNPVYKDKKYKLVYLEWCDAIASGMDWTYTDIVMEWGEKSNWVVRECGWLISETKEYIVIASTWKPEDELCQEQFKQLMKIPKTWIIRRKDIKL